MVTTGNASAKDFPLLARQPHLIYLDSAATAQKPRPVLEAMDRFYAEANANIHRGLYPLSEEATRRYEEARATVARLIGAPADRLIFTSGTTDALNLVAHGLRERLAPGDEILLTPHEHHANIVPWQQAAKATGARLVYCGLNEDLTIDVEDLKTRIGPKTKILAITHVSNVLGTLTPLADIIPYAKSGGVIVVVDGAQAVPHLEVDVRSLGCDAYAFSGHKALGPTGIGALYLSDELMGMEPYRTGGDMIDDVTDEGAEFARGEPRRFEAGTPNIAGAIGLAAAADYLLAAGLARVHERELALTRLAWDGLSRVEGVRLHGPAPSESRIGIVTFSVEGVHPHDVGQVLADDGVCIRSGKHCTNPLHARMGAAEGTNRASFHIYNSEEDVAALVKAVAKAKKVFA